MVNMKYTDICPIFKKITTMKKVYMGMNTDKNKRRRDININDLSHFTSKHAKIQLFF